MQSLSSRSKSKSMVVLAAASSLALVLAGCTDGGDGGGTGGGSLADMEPVVLTLSDPTPPSGPGWLGSQAFMEYITEQTDGKVTFETYYGGSLIPATETLAGVGSGLADVGFLANTWNPEDLPISNLFNRGGGSQNDVSFPLGYFQGYLAAQDFSVNNELLQAEYEENNVHLLSMVGSLNYNLLCTSEISTPAQAEGKRVRVGGATWGAEVEALGASQTFLDVTEMYEGLQRGVVDCVSLQAQSYVDYSLWEVATHYTPRWR